MPGHGFINQDQDFISVTITDGEPVKLFEGGGGVIIFLTPIGKACSEALHALKLLDVDVREAGSDTIELVQP